MDQHVKPTPRLTPLPPDPALNEQFDAAKRSLGFVPNSLLIMQRKPMMVKAWAQMTAAVWDPQSTVDRGFKRLVAHVVSRSAGCQYCMAHTFEGAMHYGVDEKKAAAIWAYQTSPLYSPAERIALDVAVASATVPNSVTDGMFEQMRIHWTDEQIVEIVGVIALFGFLNRWNDTMGTPLEAEPLAVGETYLAPHGWTPGKHDRR